MALPSNATRPRSKARSTWAVKQSPLDGFVRFFSHFAGKRSLVALIQQPIVIKKGRTRGEQTSTVEQLRLPTELHTRGELPVSTVRGPPGELFPWDVSETGDLLLEADEGPPVDAVDHEPDLPLFAGDLAG